MVAYVPNQIRTRPYNLIKALAALNHRITLATLWNRERDLDSTQRPGMDLDGLITERMSPVRAIWNCLRALPSRYPMQACYSWNPHLAKRIAHTLKTQNFDVVHVEHLRGVRYALMLKQRMPHPDWKNPPVIWDSVDCISDLFRQTVQKSCAFRSRSIAGLELTRTEKCEGWLATQFDRVLVTSETDRKGMLTLAEKLRRQSGSAAGSPVRERIHVVPNGVDLGYFSPSNEPRAPQTLVITGKMSYHANVTAVVRFAKNVMPKIWSVYPESCLWIAGSDPSPEIRSLGLPFPDSPISQILGSDPSRILVTGTVDDIRPYLRRAAIAVAPIQYGAGIQNKVLEALACATPVVATPQAVGAIHAQHGRDLLVAQNDQHMADTLIALIGNPEHCRSLGAAGRAFVEANHDWQDIARQLVHIYENARS